MIWILAAIGIFVVLGAALIVPDWIRWARWNSQRKRAPKERAKGLRAPVAAPFWASYGGPYDSGGAGGDCSAGSFDGGGGDGGGGCD